MKTFKVAQKRRCCEERDHHWQVYFHRCSTSESGSPKRKKQIRCFIFVFFGRRAWDETHKCPLILLGLLRLHGTRPLTSCPRLFPVFTFRWRRRERLQRKKPKLTKKKKIVLLSFFAVNVCICFFLPLCTVTSCVYPSHTCSEHLYVALYLCNSCSCDYDGVWI